MKRTVYLLLIVLSSLLVTIVVAGCDDDDPPNGVPINNNPAGRLYVLNQTDGTVYIYDTKTLTRTDSIDAIVANPHYIEFSPDGQFYYLTTLESPGRIAKFSSVSNTLVDSVTMTGSPIPSAIAITSDNMFGYLCDFTAGTQLGNVHKYNLNTMSFVSSSIQAGATSHDLKITSDGSVIVVCNQKTDDVTLVYPGADTVFFVPIDPDSTRPPGQAAYGPFGIAIDHRDSLAFVACIIANQIRVLDLTTRTIVDSVDIPVVPTASPAGPTLMAVSPDNRVVYVTTQWGNSVVAVDMITKQVLADIPLSVGRSFGITMSDDGSRIYVAATNLQNQTGRIYVLDGATNTMIDSLDVGTNSFGIYWRP